MNKDNSKKWMRMLSTSSGYVLYDAGRYYSLNHKQYVKHKHACLVTVNNGNKYESPETFLVPCDSAATKDMNDEERGEIYDMIIAEFPTFTNIVDGQVDLLFDGHGEMINEEELCQSPFISIKVLPVYDSSPYAKQQLRDEGYAYVVSSQGER